MALFTGLVICVLMTPRIAVAKSGPAKQFEVWQLDWEL